MDTVKSLPAARIEGLAKSIGICLDHPLKQAPAGGVTVK